MRKYPPVHGSLSGGRDRRRKYSPIVTEITPCLRDVAQRNAFESFNFKRIPLKSIATRSACSSRYLQISTPTSATSRAARVSAFISLIRRTASRVSARLGTDTESCLNAKREYARGVRAESACSVWRILHGSSRRLYTTAAIKRRDVLLHRRDYERDHRRLTDSIRTARCARRACDC